jgi:hypothetical protein
MRARSSLGRGPSAGNLRAGAVPYERAGVGVLLGERTNIDVGELPGERWPRRAPRCANRPWEQERSPTELLLLLMKPWCPKCNGLAPRIRAAQIRPHASRRHSAGTAARRRERFHPAAADLAHQRRRLQQSLLISLCQFCSTATSSAIAAAARKENRRVGRDLARDGRSGRIDLRGDRRYCEADRLAKEREPAGRNSKEDCERGMYRVGWNRNCVMFSIFYQ